MADRYTQTINTLRSSLNLDYDLDRKILDILPKLIEARARYWTKGDHGYFTGSYSDGKSGGTPNCSGGIGVISDNGAKLSTSGQKVLTNDSGSDIIKKEEAFNPLPQDTVVTILRKESLEWIDSLSDEEIRAVMKYTFNSADTEKPKFYERLNAMLRGDIAENKTLRYYADVISSALKKNVLKHDIVCYRRDDVDLFTAFSEGDIIYPSQFLSTSVVEKGAFSKNFITEIKVPHGSCGAYIESISEYPKQREFLLDKDCRYKFIKRYGNTVELEVISQ